MKKGVNSIILVIEKGRLTDTDLKNYDFFYNILVQKKAPLIVIFNKCDKSSEFKKWHIENMEQIKKLGLYADEYLSLCFGG